MRVLIQRVNHASVSVEGTTIGQIGKGLLVFFGASASDTEALLPKLADKVVKMRIFADENEKTNLSLNEVGGGLLVVSQFTLYADCKKGNRPSFVNAGAPQHAQMLYEQFVSLCRMRTAVVETGAFGADMKVSLENDGPFTILLDSADLNM